MVRVSNDEKRASHAKIVQAGAELFRAQGIAATGVAEIMAAAGLTHGGFYRHFKSKDALVCAAISTAFDQLVEGLKRDIDRNGARKAVKNFTLQYLSQQHIDTPAIGCPIAALGAEVARGSPDIQQVIERGGERMVSLISQGVMQDGGAQIRREKATGLLVILVGAVTLARASASAENRDAIIAAARQMVRQSVQS